MKIPCVASLYCTRISTLASFKALRSATVFRTSLTFSCFHDEGNAFPSGVINPQGHSSKCGTFRVFGYGIIFKIAWLVPSADVLAEKNVLAVDSRDATKNLDLIIVNFAHRRVAHLLVPDILGRKRNGSFHSEYRQSLHEI